MPDSKTNTAAVVNHKVETVRLMKQPIELYKILKFEGLVGSGGEAKAAIAGGVVILNKVVETQKRKKIFSGDIIEFNGAHYLMHYEESVSPRESGNNTADENRTDVPSSTKPMPKSKAKTRQKKSTPKKIVRKKIEIKS